MSAPSTATATLPPTPTHYGYSHHQAYQTNGAAYPANNTIINGAPRLAPSYNSFPNNNPSTSTTRTSATSSSQRPTSTTMPASQSSSALHDSRKRERRPDWHEFYKNGPPKEIIVIDDSPPPPPKTGNERLNYTTRTVVGNGDTEHANKKRKTLPASAYDPVHLQQPYSQTNTPNHGDTGSTTISTDRTTSLQTTAPTSLGSTNSAGASGSYLEEGVVGQKRKRVTRKQTADEKKRKEIEVVGDAYSSYVPPPRPPIKAKEVHVPQLKDVRSDSLDVGSWLADVSM